MINELVFIISAVTALVLCLLALLFTKKQHSSINENVVEFIKSLNGKLDSLLQGNDYLAKKKELGRFKIEFTKLESALNSKINLKKAEKEELESAIAFINNKIGEIETNVVDNNIQLLQEKKYLNEKLNELQSIKQKELDEYSIRVANLQETLSLVKEQQFNYNKDSILQEINKFSSQSDKLNTDIDVQNDLINKTDQLIRQNNIIETEIIQAKESLKNRAESFEKSRNEFEQQISQLSQQIDIVERDLEEIGKLETDKQDLRNNILKLTGTYKSQEKELLSKLNIKDEEFNRLSKSAESKETEIMELFNIDYQKLVSREKELEAELNNTRGLAKKIESAASSNKSDCEQKINGIRNELNTKRNMLESLKREKLGVEQTIKDKLLSKLESIKSRYMVRFDELNEKSRQKDEEIYTLKTRLSIREDRLTAENLRRREQQGKIISQLTQNIDLLKNSYDVNSLEVKQKMEPFINKLNALNKTITESDQAIASEQNVLNRLLNEEKILSAGLSLLEEKSNKEAIELHNIVESKTRYIKNLLQMIIEKERLIGVERQVKQKALVN